MGENFFFSRSFIKLIAIFLLYFSSVESAPCDNDLCSNCDPSNIAFICTTCKTTPSTALLLNTVCIPNCPYGFATSPSCTANTNAVVDVTFDQSLFSGSFGPFITGTSSSTYQFFWSPETVDPIPAYKQGLYFSGSGQYLSTSNAFYPNYNVALCLWIKPINPSQSSDLLYISPGSGTELLRIDTSGGLRLILEKKTGGQITTAVNSGNSLSLASNIWYFISYTVSFSTSAGSTTMTQYLNTVVGQTVTTSNQLLRYYLAGTQTLIIGKGPYGNYNGWIYSFKFWNTGYSSWATEYSTVCGSGTNSCFVNCAYGQYWSGSSCIACASQCSNGCYAANKCNCYDSLCAVCTGWGSGLCTSCTTHASGGGATACSCNQGYYNSDGFTCSPCYTGCSGCTGSSYYQCTSCFSSYYFLTAMCLSSCPAGYTQDSTNNVCTLSTNNPLSVAFQDLIYLDNVSGVTVGSSNSNKYPTWESSDPIPSIYRGYYFTSTYYMTLSSLVISPYFTVTIWINASGAGNIVTKYNSGNYFLLTINSSGYPSLQLQLNDASTVTIAGSTSEFNAWHNIAFTGTVNSSGKTVISLYIDGLSISSATSSNASPFIDTGTFYIGQQSSSNGFTGFLWCVKVYNDNTLYNIEWKTNCPSGCSACPSELLCPDSCSFGSFLSSGSCTTCASSCSPYGCRSTDTCRLCKYKECTTCTLFDGPCTACITNASLSGGVCSCNSNAFWVASSATCEFCDNLCSTCTGTYYFLCSGCSGSAVLVGNTCLNACPYGFTSSPSCISISTTVIDQTFDTSFMGTYGIFQTSTSASTYQFWMSPDSLDPIPAYKRGLYFSSGQYLVSNTNIYLSSSVSMGLWIYVLTDGDILQKQTRLSLSSAGVVTVTLENPSQSTTSVSTTALSAFSGWTYLSFSITYTSGATTITAFKNGVSGTTLSNAAYLYRDAALDVLYLGNSSTSSSFIGFIYYFSLWNTAITDFSSKLSIPCSTSLDTSCIWSCTIGQYYSASSCTSCNSCGNLGCRRAISCNICDDALCSQCSGFGTNLCTLCVTHASGGLSVPCTCNTNYMASTDGFSCIWACFTGCGGCSSTGYYECTSCFTDYYYLNGLCLSSCPTGYTQDSTNNLCTLSSNPAISLALQDWIKLDAVSGFTVGSSSSNMYPSWTDSADPVPSIYRGYYFTSVSLMSLNSVTISPFYTVTIWVKATASGNLFLKLNGSTEMFKIIFTSSGWPAITLTLQDSSSISLSGSTSLLNSWHNIAFAGDIVNGYSKIYFYTDGVLTGSQTSSNISPFIDLGSLYIGLSNGSSGFTGFLWSLKIYNGNNHYLDEWITSGCASGCSTCPSELLCPDSCSFGSFLSSGSCTACASSCSPYGCRSTDTCRLCKYKECTTCTLFDGACTACITNASLSGGVCSCNSNAFWVASSATCEFCDNLCSTCAGTYYFLCNGCSGSAVLVGNTCLNSCPYGFTSSPSCISISTTIIDQPFDTSFMGTYGIFQTSTSASTYQFWMSPDSLDPIPAYKRGLYFSSGQYLVSNTNIYLSSSVSMGLWILVLTDGDILQKQTRLSLSSAGVVTATLENPSQSTTSVSTTALSAFSGWTYLSFTITYTSGATTITAFKNGVSGTTLSNAAYLYRDATSDALYLGKSSTSSSFIGFIYYFSLWNTAITDYSSKLSIPCSTSLDTSCIWSCTIGQYYSASSCTSCNSCGNLGCRRAVSCNICDDALCSQCSGFGINLCTLCVAHASGGLSVPCTCNTNYMASTDGFSCIWACFTGCGGCSSTGYYQCTSCFTNYYYLNGLCLSSCPTGYTQDTTNNLCTLSTTSAVSLALQDLIQLDTASGFTVGSSSSNLYPSWTDSNDPVPSIYRGYYFTSASLMSLNSLTITPFYTVTIWVKATASGNLFLKLNGSTEMFKIAFTSSGWPEITLTLQDSSSVSLSGSISLLNSWHNIAFTGDIASGYSKINFYTDGVLTGSQTSSSISPFIDLGSLYIGYSNGSSSFTGFLWSLKIYNGNTHYLDEWITSGCSSECSTCPSELLCPDSCSFGSFLSSGSCTTCDGSCSPYGCRSTDTCRLCKYKECTTCTLFDGPCTACITNASLSVGICSCNSNAFWVASSETCELCDNLCSNCVGTYYFLCSSCSGSAVLVGNVCLNACPYDFSITPSCTITVTSIIDQAFDTSFMGTYGIFQTSTSSATYQFWNSPDSLDPIPAYKRGLYFTSGQYLVSNTNIYLSNSASMGLWIYVLTDGDILQKQTRLSLSSAGVVTVTLENPSQSTTSVSTTALSAFSGWTYLSFTITYTSGATTITAYNNGVSGTTLSNAAYIYRDAASDVLYLGKSSTSSSFVGFIYYFSLWNTAITDFSSKFSIPCSTSLDTSCIWSCTIGQYYSASSCTSCNNCGNLGCRRGISCSICDDPLCSQCSGFGTNLCTLCVTHASGGLTVPCACDTNYIASADGFSCIWACTSGCAGCSSTGYYQCTSCFTNYYYLNGMCLTSCPTGYTQDSTNNLCNLSSTTAISLTLQDLIQLDTVSGFTVGSSNSNIYPSWTDSDDPVPSIYRGYYFTSASLMSLNSLTITPFYTVTIWVKATSSGNLFLKLNGSIEMFKIAFTSSGWPEIILRLQDSSHVSLSGSISLLNSWHNIAFTGDIASGYSKINFYTDGVLTGSQTSSSISPFIDLGFLYIGYSNGSSSFTGFLWSLKIYNGNTHYLDEWITSGCPSGCSTCPSELLCPDSCSFGSFLSSGSCTTCDGSCSPYGCRSTDTCRLCKYKECTTCTLFDGPCTACITNASLSVGICSCNINAFWVGSSATCELCDNLCSSCAGTYYFLCSGCSGSAILVGNVCLNDCPYGYSTSPSCISISTTVIDQSFDTNFMGAYGIFQTSTSASTYQFWNSPDTTDPIPAYKRGLYFSSGQYLVSNTNIYLSNSVSIGLWIYVITDGDIFQKQTRLSLSSGGIVAATLENPSQSATSVSTTALSAFSGWTYLSFTITYTGGATTITAYNNGISGTTLSNAGYLYRDAASDVLYLGKSSTSPSFIGFIYYFSLWNTAITDFSSKFSVPCGSSLDTNCLWSCPIAQYYDTSSCASCNSCGSFGCRRAVSCSICDDPLCSQCSGFGVNLCILCVTHASGGSTVPCTCDTNYIASADGFSCIWACTSGCAGCSSTGYYQCTSCFTNYYYLNGMCLTSCPTGYTQDSTNNVCNLSSTTVISLTLQDLIQLDTVSGFTVGSSNSNIYPSWTDSADPVPSIYRGYYFTSASLMYLNSLTITPFYTVTIWVKATSSGNLFLKLNGSTEMFKIAFTSSGWPEITLTLQDSSNVSLSGSISLLNSWHNIAFTGDIASGYSKINFYTDGLLISNQISTNISPFIDIGFLYIGYSNGSSSFTGFLWSLKIYNGNTHYLDEWITSGCSSECSTCPSELLCPDSCSFGSFLSSGSCTTCDGSCSPYGCRSTDTCRLCKYKECTTCTLFDGPCTACITNASLSVGICSCNINAFWVGSSATCELCDNLCSTCAGTYYFLCNGCSGSAVLVGNVCLNDCPYGYSTSPSCISISTTVIDQSFDTDFMGTYGIFTTSTSGSTYQFWNTPDLLDPIPAFKRGLYFSSGKYLISDTNIYLSNSVSMGLWVYVVTSGDILQKETRLSLSSYGAITVILESPSQSTTTITTASATPFLGWTYLSLSIEYTSGSTIIKTYTNNSPLDSQSTSDYIYRDLSADYLYLGKSSTSSTFEGFIYYFSLWNAAITDFSSKFSIPCSLSLDTSCLWSCPMTQYYDTSSCLSCNSCGDLGCRRAISCSICEDPLCSQCSGFGTNLCTLCVTHASGGLTVPCTCNTNYIASTDGFSCIWACTSGCAGCSSTGYYQCTSCFTNYYYLNGMCLTSCPTGYTQDSTNNLCNLSSTTAISLTLQDLIQLDTVSGFTVGSSNSNIYPSWTDSADPVPSIYRGYYFTSSSLMSLNSLTITPFYTVTIWVKATSSGNLFLKLNGSTEMFKIDFATAGWPRITLKLQDSSIVSLSGSTSLFNSWHNIAFTGDIVSGNTKISFYEDGLLISSQASTNAFPFIDAGILYLGYSSRASSFVGFLWSVKVFNGNTHFLDEWQTTSCAGSCSNCPSELICPDDCEFGSFYSSGSCTACAVSCSSHGCRSSLTCRLCQNKECTTCTLFDGPCTACIANTNLSGGVCSCTLNAFWVQSSETCEICDNLCSTCLKTDYFECSACTGTKVLVDTVCLNECPYSFTSSPSCTSSMSTIIDQSFDTAFQGSYGILTTSSSSLTYQFFSNPDSTDPVPSYARGLYFSGSQYLQANVNIYISYQFSVGLWIYTISHGDIFQKQARIKLASNGIANIILESPSQTTTTVTTSSLIFNGWSYLSLTVSYLSGSTTTVISVNNVAGTTIVSTNLLFRDVSSDILYIGKSTSSGFNGFIYYFSLWNTAISDFSAKLLVPCGSSLSTSCLWSCDISQYYDGIFCQSCNSCALGCSRGVSCNICYDPLCSICSGFGSGLCTQCVSHASGGGATACSCDVNYIQATDGFSCIWGCTIGCGGCSGTSYYQCTSCLTMYYFISGLCITVCPTGYTQDSVNNQCTLVSNLSFSLQFQDLIYLDTVSGVQVGSSSTNTYPTFESTDPVPSIYRGYYFVSNSYMLSTSLILNTYFTVTIWVKPISSGYLMLKINGSDEIFKISLSSSGIPTLKISLQDLSTVSVSGPSNLFNSWHNIAFTSDIINGKMKIYFYNDGTLSASQLSANASPFIDLGTLKLGASSGSNGFTGFLWSLKVFNSNSNYLDEWQTTGCSGGCSSCPSELICPDNCNFGSFYSSGCTTCDSSCSPYGCRSSLTCRLCLQKECLECTRFDGACTSCIDRATLTSGVCACNSNAFWVQSSQTCEYCDALCAQCAGAYYFLCNTCTTGEILAGNVCLHECPYGFGSGCSVVSTQVITQSFDQDFSGSYGIFTTATSSSTFQFFNTPEANDPIPAKNRGLYFSSGKYLESSVSIYLSYELSLGFWAYVETAGDLFEKQNRIIINSSGSAKIILESPSLAATTVTTGTISSSGWSYYSITISYSSGSTTATVYINNIAGTPSSTSNYIFRDIASQTILIGKSSSSNFSGFIYNFNLWNSPITDFSAQVNDDICGIGLGSSCLWSCGINYYYLNTGGSCSLCNHCSLGCARGVSCSICEDKLCAVCSGFGPGICTTCVAHASGSVCTCDFGYNLSSDGFACNICSNGCSSCSGINYYQCLTCVSPYYYINGLCEPNCPTGYTQNSITNNCDLSSSLALYLDLTDQLRLDKVSGFTVGSDSTNTYPSWDPYDPIPAIQRGYYFTGASYMTTSFKFSPFFSISSWINGLNDGYFLTKYDSWVYLSISFAGGIPTLTVNLLDGTTVSVSASSSLFNAWTFFSFSGQIASDGTSKFISYVNSILIDTQISTSLSFLRDTNSGSLILGADQTLANGFEGYVWNLRIYSDNNYAITDWTISGCGSGCSYCPSNLVCLSGCSLNTYPSSCNSCKAECNHGCVYGSTCRLCKAKECLSCNTFTGACLSCISNASLSGTTCKCIANYIYVDSSESCEPCKHSACATCFVPTWAGCNSCSSSLYLFESLCIKKCPLGYWASANKCSANGTGGYIYNLRPSQIKDKVYDLQSGIIASTGNDTNFYPSYQESDPYAAQYRGYYFNGKSYMNITPSSRTLVLAPKFTMSMWLNPSKSYCDLFTKQSISTSVITYWKLSIYSWYPSLRIRLNDNSTVFYTSTSRLIPSEWNLLTVFSDISVTPAQIISFSINTSPDISSDLGFSWFEDIEDSFKITIGSSFISNTTFGNYFTGFLWDLKIRNKIVDASSLYLNSCFQSSYCPIENEGVCIPNCAISEYWDGMRCTPCNDACSGVGCVRYDKTCNLCNNVICNICDDFIAGSCLQCKEHAYLSSGECICDNGYYLNKTQEECLECEPNQYSVNGICKNCPKKCGSCLDPSVCYTCIETAELSQNTTCVCKIGYNGTECTPAYFKAYLAVNDDNSLNLTFSENLIYIISKYDIAIYVSNISTSDYSWTMERVNNTFYMISLSSSVEISSNTPIILKLLNLTYFVSETNAVPENDTLNGNLYDYNPNASTQTVKAITSQTTAAIQSIIGTSLAVAFINPNPASLWSLLNTLDYISCLALTKIPMSDSFYAFVKNMNGYHNLPNFFDYFMVESQGTKPYDQAVKYGYNSDLFLLNVGGMITMLLIIFSTLPIVYFLSKWGFSRKYLARKLEGLLKIYKYSIFVRFWIQTYLDISITALVSLLNFSFGNITQITNSLICLWVFVFVCITPPLVFMLSYKNQSKIQNKNLIFSSLWGSFFYEFKNNKGLLSTQFYTLFFGRRFIYLLNITFLNEIPEFQIAVNVILSVTAVLFLIRYKPYNEPILLVANTMSEIATLLIMGLLSANLFDLSSSMQGQFETTMIAVAIGVMAIQSASSVAIFGKTCYRLIKIGIEMNSPPKDKFNTKVNGKENRRTTELDSIPSELSRSVLNNTPADMSIDEDQITKIIL